MLDGAGAAVALYEEALGAVEIGESWFAARLPILKERIRDRLSRLSDRLGNTDWLDGPFSAGDLALVGMLRRLKCSPLLGKHSNLPAFCAAKARPAFAAQKAVFEASRR